MLFLGPVPLESNLKAVTGESEEISLLIWPCVVESKDVAGR